MTDQTPWKEIQEKLRDPNQPEDERLESWLKEAGNQRVFDDLKVIYAVTGHVPETFIPQKDQAWQQILKRVSVRTNKINLTRTLLQIAASILLVALGVGGGILLQKRLVDRSFTEIYSPYGHKTLVVLPDGSEVWLNGNTQLKYHSDFRNSRNLELTGEALFKVQKNPEKMFTVKSAELKLEVYGTTFDVKAYPEDVNSEVTLVEGSVGLYGNKKFLKTMTPGEVVTYNTETDTYSSRRGNISQIISWRADELVIDNQTFDEVVKYLERWYGVTISLDKSMNQNLRLSFKVKTESLIELLSIINHITPISYEIDGKHVSIYRHQPLKSKIK